MRRRGFPFGEQETCPFRGKGKSHRGYPWWQSGSQPPPPLIALFVVRPERRQGGGELLELLIYLCSYSGNLGSQWSSLETLHLIRRSRLFLENPVGEPAAEGVPGSVWLGQSSRLPLGVRRARTCRRDPHSRGTNPVLTRLLRKSKVGAFVCALTEGRRR